MMRFIALALVGALTALLLRKTQPSAALAVTVTACAALLVGIVPKLMEILDTLAHLAESAGALQAYRTSVQLVGISLAGDFASRTCKELGSENLGAQVELAGRAAICLTLLPVVKNLLEIINRLLVGI